MGWFDITSNQTVSFTNLKDGAEKGILLAKTTIPISNKQITKAEADTYIYLDTSYAPYAGKTSNQLVVKNNLLSNLVLYSTAQSGFTGLIRSFDEGLTWNEVPLVTGSVAMQSVATSNNGVYVIAGRSGFSQPGSGRLSQTSGNTWLDMTAVVPTTLGIHSCVISGSGQYMVITQTGSTTSDQKIFTSSDYGSSFAVTRSNDGTYPYWQAGRICMSDSGQYITIAVPTLNVAGATYSGLRIRSTDYGATWLSAVNYGDVSNDFGACAMSSTGQYQILGFNGQISVSSSFGNTWSFVNPSGTWQSMDVSESGQYMLAMTTNSILYRSENFGQTWTLVSTYAATGVVKFASNERTAFMAIKNEYFYRSNDYGASFSLRYSSGTINWNNILAVASRVPLSGTVSYSTNSGLYPVNGSTLVTANITITNGLNYNIFLWGSFNSGGANSGNISGDKLTSAGYPDINMSGTVSSFGQTIYSSTAWELPTGASIVLTVTKNDGIGSGSTMRVAYSQTLTSAKTNI
jgi:hypothetical protein